MSTSDVANSPTLTLGHSITGHILGTAAYMAPEQVEGRAADRRADIWSFGAVLFEMLAGKRAFVGSTNVETLASVVKTDPDWSALPKDTPAHIRNLIRRCLIKDRKQRLQAIGEARIVLENPPAAEQGAVAPKATARSRFAAPALLWAVVATLAAAALATVLYRVANHREAERSSSVGRLMASRLRFRPYKK
jgi:serine/threonine protein kinase